MVLVKCLVCWKVQVVCQRHRAGGVGAHSVRGKNCCTTLWCEFAMSFLVSGLVRNLARETALAVLQACKRIFPDARPDWIVRQHGVAAGRSPRRIARDWLARRRSAAAGDIGG